jgi:hypothetical protein
MPNPKGTDARIPIPFAGPWMKALRCASVFLPGIKKREMKCLSDCR